MPISLWVGEVVGGVGNQFSDRCLYTTYRCRRNSEWLPWRLTTTHRSRQGNRKNIINKGTNFPSNKRSLNAPALPHPKNLTAAVLQLRTEYKKEEEERGRGCKLSMLNRAPSIITTIRAVTREDSVLSKNKRHKKMNENMGRLCLNPKICARSSEGLKCSKTGTPPRESQKSRYKCTPPSITGAE